MKCSYVLACELGAVLAVGLLGLGCSSGGGGGSNGGDMAGGGLTQTHETTSFLGGAMPTGGTTAVSGGTTAASGGTTAAAGGAPTPPGGTTAAHAGETMLSGGVLSAGGSTAASGGTSSSTGGTPAATGGASKPAGGSTSTTAGSTAGPGGTTGATAGSTSATGGSTAMGGTSKTGGTAVATSGTTAATGGTTTATGGTASASGNEFWISPTGKDTAAGTQADPLFTLCDDALKTGACYKLCPVGGTCASGTIWVMDGIYNYGAVTQKIGSSKLGTASSPLNVFAVAGAKPVFDFTGMVVSASSRGIQLAGDYWHLRGITVTKAGDTGIFIMGNNNTIEQCVSHHNQDAGIVIGVNSSRTGLSGANNLILNCDSYANYDPNTNGGNADGFGAKENPGGTGNVFRGCRAWENSDDGFDFYGWGSPITVNNCWVMSQSTTLYGSGSNGNGFKLGGNNVSAAHILKDLYAVGNGANAKSGDGNGNGFEANSNGAAMPCTGTCGAWSNRTAGVHGSNITGVTVTSGPTAAKMIAAPRAADGSLPAIDSL